MNDQSNDQQTDTSTPAYRLAVPRELMARAYTGTSFDPEGRARRTVAGFDAELQEDIAYLTAQARAGGTQHALDEELARYVAGFRRRVIALLHSESRCVSSFIAGPANFPVQRMQKRVHIAHQRLNDLADFRHRAKKAALRVLRPDLRPIMAGDADAIERLELEISKAERAQAQMKAANAAIRKTAKAGADHQVAALMELGYTEHQACKLLKPDFAGRLGFPDYSLSNNNANIRRMKQRLDALRVAKATPATEHAGANGVRLEDDPPANRVRLYFPGKPDQATRDMLKRNGFRWAPTLSAWQGYRNAGTLQTARDLAGINRT